MNKNKRTMVPVKALDPKSKKEIFDCVKVSHLDRLIAQGYVVAVLSKIPDKEEGEKK